jgi:hypothetical protein
MVESRIAFALAGGHRASTTPVGARRSGDQALGNDPPP